MLKSNRWLHLFNEGLWVIIGQVVSILGSLVSIRILTGLLQPSEYGSLTLGITFATLVNQVILGPLAEGVVRFYAAAAEVNQLESYFIAVKQLLLKAYNVVLITLIAIVLSLVFTGNLDWISITIVAFLFAGINGTNFILNGIQNAARQRLVVAFHQGLDSWLRFFIAALLIHYFSKTGTMGMLGYAIGALMVCISQLLNFFKSHQHLKFTEYFSLSAWGQKIWDYSLPFASFGLFTWGQFVSDRWALELFSNRQNVGMYAVVFQLGYYPISISTGMILQFLMPILFRRVGDASDTQRNAKNQHLIWRLSGLALGFTGVVFVFTWLFNVQVFYVFAAPEYRTLSHLLPWMVLSGGLYASGQTISLSLLSQIKTDKMVAVKIFTAILGIILNFLGAYWQGVVGVVYANVVFSGAYFIWIGALAIREQILSERMSKIEADSTR
jgi:O-antigen/teichoic acid export membrane protein